VHQAGTDMAEVLQLEDSKILEAAVAEEEVIEEDEAAEVLVGVEEAPVVEQQLVVMELITLVLPDTLYI